MNAKSFSVPGCTFRRFLGAAALDGLPPGRGGLSPDLLGVRLSVLLWAVASFLGWNLGSAQASPAAEALVSLRVMTYNIHHGEGIDGKLDLARIAELIKRQKADIVALQEVDQGVERTAKRDLPAELASLTGLSCVFSNNLSHQGGQYGNAILTRFPVLRATNTHLAMVQPGAEQRGVLQLVLAVQGRELVFMSTHLDQRPNDAERVQSADQIFELLHQYGSRPIILCGDFNDVPTSRTCQKLAGQFIDSWTVAGEGDGFTIPVKKSRKRIDYLWIAKDRGLRPVKLEVPVSEGSDHLPVVGEFQWEKP